MTTTTDKRQKQEMVQEILKNRRRRHSAGEARATIHGYNRLPLKELQRRYEDEFARHPKTRQYKPRAKKVNVGDLIEVDGRTYRIEKSSGQTQLTPVD